MYVCGSVVSVTARAGAASAARTASVSASFICPPEGRVRAKGGTGWLVARPRRDVEYESPRQSVASASARGQGTSRDLGGGTRAPALRTVKSVTSMLNMLTIESGPGAC